MQYPWSHWDSINIYIDKDVSDVFIWSRNPILIKMTLIFQS